MTERIKSYVNRKILKRLGPALQLALSPADMMILWKPRKHNTFDYDPKCHSHLRARSEETEFIEIPKLFHIKVESDLDLTKAEVTEIFSKHEVISSLMSTDYRIGDY